MVDEKGNIKLNWREWLGILLVGLGVFSSVIFYYGWFSTQTMMCSVILSGVAFVYLIFRKRWF